MSTVTAFGSAAHWLDAPAVARLRGRIELALRRSRASGSPVIVSVTARSPRAADPSAIVAASRRPDEPWFALEQPDRGGWALAALGAVKALEAAGRGALRRHRARRGASSPRVRWRIRSTARPVRDWSRSEGSRSRRTGATRRRGAGSRPRRCVLPELSFARMAGSCWLTVNLDVAPDDTVEGLERPGAAAARRARRTRAAAARSGSGGRIRGAQLDAPGPLRGRGGAGRGADPRRRAREGRAGARGRGPRADRPRPRRRDRDPARGVPVVLRVRGRPRRRDVHGGQPGAARAPGGPAREHRRAGGLDAAQRRSGGRRPSRRAAAAEREGPRGERDRGPADRAGTEAARRVGHGRTRAVGRAGGEHPAPGLADPRPARGADRRDRARRHAASDAGGRRRADRRRRSR